MSSPRKRMIQSYQEIIVIERKVELPQDSLILTLKQCTYDGRRHLRINGSKCQYNLDHFLLFKLEKYYQKKLSQDLWQRFQQYFEYQMEGPIIVRDLRLVILPTSTVLCQNGTQRYSNYNIRENINLKVKLDYEITISYLAFLVLSFIKGYKPLASNSQGFSLREEIVILLLQENSLVLNFNAKQDLLSYFDFDFMDQKTIRRKQNLFNPKIYSQTRFMEAKYSKSLVFNPTVFTNQIIDIGIRHKFLLKGMSGVGKSCSLVLQVQLCKLITNFLYNDAARLNFLVRDQEEYEKTPKYIYISLSQNYQIQDYRTLIELQIHPELTKECQEQSRQSFISSVIQAYEKRSITVIFVLDQINLYFSCIRKCDQIQQKREEEEKRSQSIAEKKVNERKKQQRRRSSSHQIQTQSGSSRYIKHKKKKKEYKQVKEDDHLPENQSSDNNPKDYYKFVNQFYRFHKELAQQQANILYSSSLNFERIIPKETKPKWFLHKDPYINLNLDKLSCCEINMRQRAPKVGLTDFINVVWFEIQLKLRGDKKYKMLKVLQQEKKVLIQNIPTYLIQIFQNLPIGLTHLRISKYLNKIKQNINRFSPQDTQIFYIKHKSQEILANFQIFLINIIEFCLDEFVNDFRKFLNKGRLDFVYEKYQLFNIIKLECQLNIGSTENIRISSSKINLKNCAKDFNQLIDQDHGRIQNNQIVLNYPPLFFIQIADKIQDNFSVMDSILRKLIENYGSINSVFGSMFDNCCTRMLTLLNVSLTLGPMTYNLQSDLSQTFEHLYPRQVNVDIRHKFKKLFQVLEETQQWIAASPRVKFPNLQESKQQYSVTSRCIDCLLMKKASKDQYLLRTIDFAMTFSQSKIDWKITKAKTFFNQFFSNSKKASLKFTLEHFIIVRHHIQQQSKTFEFQEINYTITVLSILKMKILLLQQSYNEKRIDDCTPSLFKCFMESLSKDEKYK